MQEAEAITFFVINALEAFVIIIGNTFTIFVFWTQRSHLKRTCVLLINLAVADLLVGITEPIVLATEKIPRSKAPRRGEQNITNDSSAFQILGSSTSVFFLALISLERVFAVLRPLRHRVMTTRAYIYSVLVVWAVGMCLLLPRLIPQRLDMTPVNVSELSCRFVSLLIMCASYVKMHNRLHSRAQGLKDNDRKSREHMRNLRLSRTFFIIVALSLVFWLPASVVYTIHDFCRPCFPPYAIAIVNILHLANSMVNPFVYTFRMPIFKDVLKKSWWKQRGVQIRPNRVCGSVPGRGSSTPQMEHTVSTPDITLTAWHQSTENIEKIQAVGISINRRPQSEASEA